MKKSLHIRHLSGSLNMVPGRDSSRSLLQGHPDEKRFRFYFKEKLPIPTQSGYRFILLSHIESLSAASNYTTILLQNGEKITLSKTMKSLVDQLDDRFYRIHNSTIINIEHLKEVEKGNSKVTLDSGNSYLISRNRKRDFLTLLSNCI